MKTVSVKITVPNKKDKWTVSVGSGTFKRPDAVNVYNYVERRLLASRSPLKINAIVDYGVLHPLEPRDWKNEGSYVDRKAALYALACFLEDFVSKEFLTDKRKKYL